FLQADGGIRDFHVTGVQPCALPICGVLLLGEALGEEEAKEGRPFVGKAGFMLTRLLQWAGLDRSDFAIANSVWCRPPSNKLDGRSEERRVGQERRCRGSPCGTSAAS